MYYSIALKKGRTTNLFGGWSTGLRFSFLLIWGLLLPSALQASKSEEVFDDESYSEKSGTTNTIVNLDDHNNLATQLGDFQTEYQELKDQNDQLIFDIEEKNKQIDTLDEQIGALGSKLETSEQTRSILESEVTRLKNELIVKNQENKQLSEQNKILTQVNEKFQEANKELAEFDLNEKDKETAQKKEIEKYKGLWIKVTNEVNGKQKLIYKLQLSVIKMQQKIDSEESEISELKIQLADLINENQGLQQKIKSLTGKKEDCEQKIKEKEDNDFYSELNRQPSKKGRTGTLSKTRTLRILSFRDNEDDTEDHVNTNSQNNLPYYTYDSFTQENNLVGAPDYDKDGKDGYITDFEGRNKYRNSIDLSDEEVKSLQEEIEELKKKNEELKNTPQGPTADISIDHENCKNEYNRLKEEYEKYKKTKGSIEKDNESLKKRYVAAVGVLSGMVLVELVITFERTIWEKKTKKEVKKS